MVILCYFTERTPSMGHNIASKIIPQGKVDVTFNFIRVKFFHQLQLSDLHFGKTTH